MTAYLKPGDRIMLAVPDFHPGNTADEDHAQWQLIYDKFGVNVESIHVHHALTHPVVVAVLRDDNTEEDKTCA